MADTDLVKGNKEILILEFQRLYPLHEKKWRSLLKKHNEWHCTYKALTAWGNIKKGTVGNESLRLIISDMQAIETSDFEREILRKQGLSRRRK